MKTLFYTLILLIAFVFASCTCSNKTKENAQNKENVAPDMHTAENSLNFHGTYEGTLPTASGPGMKLSLNINKDNTYKLVTKYIGKDEFTDEGKFTIENSIITLDLKDGQKQYYKIEEGRLVFLDQNKNKIEGELADMYILNQVTVK